jgi:tripartite-type tricarboxylate transporter receptor subunit TctC
MMKLIRRNFLRLACGAIASPAVLSGALAQQGYPARPVRLVVSVAAGGTNDVTARMIAQKLSDAWKQQVYVENVPGGGEIVGTGQVAKAAPDGYTALFATGAFTLNPSLHSKLPYDTLKDFAPVTLVASGPHALAVNPSLPAKNVQELVALLRANPGKYSFASSGANTQPRLVGELFKLKFGVDMVQVPFNGGGPAITSTIGGHTPMAFTSLGNSAPAIKAGQLRALALTSAKRLTEFPDVPTMAEEGAPELVTGSLQGVVLPAGTPQPVIQQWHGAVTKIVAMPEIRDKLIGFGLEPVGNTPAEFADWIRTEIEKWGKAMQAAKIDRI